MLILTRKPGETVIIGEHCEVKIVVLGMRNNQVRLGFEADPSIVVYREEIYNRIKREQFQQIRQQEFDEE